MTDSAKLPPLNTPEGFYPECEHCGGALDWHDCHACQGEGSRILIVSKVEPSEGVREAEITVWGDCPDCDGQGGWHECRECGKRHEWE